MKTPLPVVDLALGIDIGSSAVRLAALDRAGALVASSAVPLPAPVQDHSGITQDAALWRRALEEAFADIGRRIQLRSIRTLAVDGTSGTVLPVDADGRPLAPARLYNDPAPAEAALIAPVAPLDSAARGATSALARAMRLASTPGTVRILHQADWVAGQFTGRFDVSDENNALKTGYDPVARAWPDWIARTGFDMRMLPEVRPAGTPIARLDRAKAQAWGLAEDTLVVTGTTDGCAAFLATGADRPGEAVTSLGTTLVLKLLSETPLSAPQYGLYSHRIGDTWLAGGASNAGGAGLLKFFTADAMKALEPRLKPDEPTGLDFYPLPSPGERFPINDPALQPRTGPRPPDDAVFLQGLLEGIAQIEAMGYARLRELGGPPLVSVRTVGGGARNHAWTRIRARTLGVPVAEAAATESSVGTARLAWRGLMAAAATRSPTES
jgi:D-ribulokinase